MQVVNIHSEHLNEDNVREQLGELDALLVAPGFGSRGVEGKIKAVQYARENNLPFLGICLGMQMAVIEYARNVMGLSDAHSTEMEQNTSNPVIALMDEQKKIKNKGGTMRLGSYACQLDKDSLAYSLYKSEFINERHRHRWEFNNQYQDAFLKAGLSISGVNPDKKLVEIIELKKHPFFIGVQFHPELKSTVENPHPLFLGLVSAAKAHATWRQEQKTAVVS